VGHKTRRSSQPISYHKCSAVAEMGDRLATIGEGKRSGGENNHEDTFRKYAWTKTDQRKQMMVSHKWQHSMENEYWCPNFYQGSMSHSIKIGHFRDVVPSQSLSMALKKNLN